MASKARLFYTDKLKTGTISRLSEKQSHYTKNVMRLKAGDKISLFNSQDGEWDAKILDQGKIFTEFKVEKLSRPISKEKNIWLAFSPIKKIALYFFNISNFSLKGPAGSKYPFPTP